VKRERISLHRAMNPSHKPVNHQHLRDIEA
jgi:hypothetical protein